jgi:SAM-dependent methyltransferase
MTATAEPASRPPTVPDLLRSATDRSGRTPEQWLTSAFADVDGPVLELRAATPGPARRVSLRLLVAAGPGPDERSLPGRSAPPAEETGLADAHRLPVRTNGVAGVRAVMCLPVVEPLNGLFAELRRVLRPTGTVAALVPSRPGLPLLTPRGWRPLNQALAGHPGFRHESARDHLSWLVTAADFAVLADQRRVFWIPVPDRAAAEDTVAALGPAGVWPPDVPADQARRAAEGLARYAAPGRRLPIALRLLVGRR